MAIFKDSVADDLTKTLRIENLLPTVLFVAPNLAADPLPLVDGTIFYDTVGNKLKAVINGVVEELAVVWCPALGAG